jgi:CBS domain-containing protein
MKTLKAPAVISVMTPFPYTIDEGGTLNDARDLMYEHSFRHLPVTSKGKLTGVISDRDIKIAFAIETDPEKQKKLKVSDACFYEPYIVDVHEHIDHISSHMAKRHIGSALVTREGKLAGIFTSTDACRILGEIYGNSGSEIPDELA